MQLYPYGNAHVASDYFVIFMATLSITPVTINTEIKNKYPSTTQLISLAYIVLKGYCGCAKHIQDFYLNETGSLKCGFS